MIPPKPAGYFNDYAGVVNPQSASQLNEQLAQFERSTSSQIVVAVFPKMQSDSSIEDYTLRVARAWQVGQKANNSGAVLFVFIQDHKMFIQTGYGLEGALPDILCKQIIDNEITPRFKQGDYTGGLNAGVNAMMAAARGEYKGTGTTHLERNTARDSEIFHIVFWILIIGLFIVFHLRRRTGTGYSGSGFGVARRIRGRIFQEAAAGDSPGVADSADSPVAAAVSGAAAREGAGDMHHKEFLSQIEHDKVVASIADAEKLTSGEIRVWISHRKITNALESAQRRFHKLGMHKSPGRNGVLVYIAPRSRSFAVIGDKEVHEKCGDAFWTEVTAQLAADLKKESFTEALVNAVRKIGGMLAIHFPCKADGKKHPHGGSLSD